MGVHGLWRLIDPSGKPVPLETLENKVLAVDVSIWLHQAIKGFQDTKGAPIPNAHLLGIFHRVCKLLYYRIQPIFVFDGGVPVLKRQTIAKRSQQKSKNTNDANQLQKQILNSLLKHSAINAVLSSKAKASLESVLPKTSTNKGNDIFELPATPELSILPSSSDNESDSSDSLSPTKQHWDLHTIDERSAEFKSLPVNVRHEILSELKETRKQSSWGRIHELPTESNDFSGYQMKRLLKRYSVQASLEETEKEMGGTSLSLGELEDLLTNHGVIAKAAVGKRIASDENKRYLYVKNIKKAIEEASALKEIQEEDEEMKEGEEKKDEAKEGDDGRMHQEDTKVEEISDEPQSKRTKADLEYEQDLDEAIKLSLQNKESNEQLINLLPNEEKSEKSKADLEYEQNLKEAIRLSLQNEPTTSKNIINPMPEFLGEADYDSDSTSSVDEPEQSNNILTSAKSYMMEYSGLTPAEISKIINKNSKSSISSTTDGSSKALNEINENSAKTLLTQNKNISISNSNVLEESVSTIPEREDLSKNITELPEISRIDSDSDESDDFLEVSVENVSKTESSKASDLKETKNGLEIIIDKNSKLEDDLFNDIFKNVDEKQEILIHQEPVEAQNDKKEESNIEEANKNESNSSANDANNVNPKQSELLNDILKDPLLQTNKSNRKITESKLLEIKSNVAKEADQLASEKANKERLANNITEQMRQEAQELLQLFGVPYVIAPMEAEAQCAFFNEIKLTDGTITDDSDIWLFGGKTVYKNFFNQSKHVLEFTAEDIQHCFKLSRYEMILLALLVGSDYTNGIQGIGPVTALEIIAAFPAFKNEINITQSDLVSSLTEFRKWFKSKSSKPALTTLRHKLKNVELAEQFPSSQVIQAYLEPTVETSDEAFSWDKPDVVSLIDFAKEKFGWNQKKSEEILKPIMKRLDEIRVQKKITNYFKTKHKILGNLPEDKMSKRVKRAIDKLGNNGIDTETSSEKVTKKSSKAKKKTEGTKSKSVRTKNPTKTKIVKSDSVKNGDEKLSTKDVKIKNPATTNTETENERNHTQDEIMDDEEVKILTETKKFSQRKTKAMKIEFNEMLLRAEAAKNKPSPSNQLAAHLHRKEVVPQKEKNKAELLRSKMKAIEVFRKSKHGPGFVKRRETVSRQPKDDAELSENSDS